MQFRLARNLESEAVVTVSKGVGVWFVPMAADHLLDSLVLKGIAAPVKFFEGYPSKDKQPSATTGYYELRLFLSVIASNFKLALINFGNNNIIHL